MSCLRVGFFLPGLGRVQRGAETAFLEIARGLSQLGVEVELFGSGKHGTEGLTTHVIACKTRERFEQFPHFPGLRSETYYEELSFTYNLHRSRTFTPTRFKAVFCCSYPYLNWYLRFMSGKKGPRHIFVTQNGDWPCHRRNAEFRYFNCDKLVCINPDFFNRHRDNYDCHLIPNGVDTDVFSPVGFNAPSQDKPTILIVSAFIKSKRVAEGVRAVARVPNAFLLIAGDGPEREHIRQLAQELLPGRHRLLGSIPREKMPALYRQATIFLHMSQEEPFGIVYLEAASSGLTVVTHDGPVPRWILGDTAYFANTSDLDAVACSLHLAISSTQQDGKGNAARQRILDGWTWKRQAALYRKLLD